MPSARLANYRWHGPCCFSSINGGESIMICRRDFLIGAAAAAIAGPSVVRADTTVIKMGALKLIHSIAPYFYEKFTPAGYQVEVIPFESPTEGKNAVVTKSVDFGMFGIAAATLGAAAMPN